MTYQEAVDAAIESSAKYECTQYVVAYMTMGTATTPPVIDGFGVSDWYGDAVVLCVHDGEVA